MAFSVQLSLSLARYILANKLKGVKHFPLVLMLEPSFRCNLSCAGCGRIREYRDILAESMSVQDCLAAVDESGAPVVSITGGEPLLHDGIGDVVAGAISRGRFVHLCTNGLLLEQSLGWFRPGPRMSFVLHLDSLAESHNRLAGREGVFETAVSGIRAAKKGGFTVLINTTIYKQTDLGEVERLFTMLSQIPVDGIMVAPAFSYEAVSNDVFLSRREVVQALIPVYDMRKRFRFYNTPVYFDFLAGKRELQCSPWSTPTRNPKGWKRPCYLITDDHCGSFRELRDETRWESYGTGRDARCANCMVHCGFEGGAVEHVIKSPVDMLRTLKWDLFS